MKKILFVVLMLGSCLLVAEPRKWKGPRPKFIVIGTTVHKGAGFFCEVQKVLIDLIHFDQQGILALAPDWRHPFYPFKDHQDENGWDLFFESIPQDPCSVEGVTVNKIVVPWNEWHEIHGRFCTAQWVLYDQYLPYREYVHSIMKKYFKVKDHITAQLNQFYKENMEGHYCIGVHIRFAAVHAFEVPGGKHPSLEEYCAEIDQLIIQKQHLPIKIFLATDSNYVVQVLKMRYKNLLYYAEAPRSIGAEDPVFSLPLKNLDLFNQKRPGYKAGLYVLLDGLTLSKCDVMIHTTSNFASLVSFFNPYIKSIYLPKGFDPVCIIQGQEDQNEVKNPFLNKLAAA